MTRPNILFIMSDNQPADMLGCYGNSELVTPHLDGLARNGVQFNQAYCVNAMCSPCRASVLTGQMPSQHGVHNWLDDRMMDHWPKNWSAIGDRANLPSLMKAAGYTTAMIGKFHLGVPFKPQLGFDHWVTFPHGHTTSFYGNEVIDQNDRYRHEGHTVEFFTDKTIAFLEDQKDKPDPFFAFIPFNGPYGHWPAIKGRGPEPFAQLYDDTPIASVPREGLNPDVLERFGLRVKDNGVREQFKGPLLLPNNIEALRNYFAQISLIDHSVGRIQEALQRLGLDENTIVIYTSDHGFSLGHNGIWGHGAAAFPASAYRPSYHIPLIFSGGPIEPAKPNDAMVSQIDLFPTLLSLTQADQPGAEHKSAGKDLVPLLGGEPADAFDAVFYEQEETRAIRTKDWVLAMRFQAAPSFPMQDALFDLGRDPEEKLNVIHDPEYSHIERQLRQKLTSFFEQHTDPNYDLWSGGSAKSNVTYDTLWTDAWGPEWAPEHAPR